MRKELNKLKDVLLTSNIYDENTSDCIFNNVMYLVDELEAKIVEVEKRMECVDRTANEIRLAISNYTEKVDEPEPFIMTVANHDSILRGANDILVAIDFEDDEPIENNWYGLFEVKEELSHGGIPYRHCAECNIKEEETVMTKMDNGLHLCCDCNPPTELCKTPQTHEFVKDIIAKLKVIDVDGETMQYILQQVGMEDQMLRQLVMSNPESDTKDLLEEKRELNNKSVRGCIEI